MGQQQQQGNGRLLQPDGDEHQSQVGGGAVGEGSLEIHLGDGHKGTRQGADGAHHQQHRDSQGREAQQGHHLHQHQSATGDHRRIPQDGGGIGSFHGLIQPEMHRELGAFSHRSGDQTQPDEGAGQRGDRSLLEGGSGPLIQGIKGEGRGPGGQGHHTHQQQHIAHPLGEEGVSGCRHHQGLGIPEAHEQVGGEGKHLQQEVGDEKVAAEHHPSHRPLKKAHQGVEACQRPFLIEVAQGEHLAHQAHEGDQLQGSQICEGEIKADAQIQISHLKPAPVDLLGTQGEHITKDEAPVHHGQQCKQQIQIGRRSGTIAFDPSGGPGKGEDHTAEPVQGNQPGQLDGKREG
jgi:hypothetical protein